MSDTKQHALIAQWRQAANEATTADAAVTYTECANALEVAIAAKILIAVCEGSGVSRHRLPGRPIGARLAAWCQTCRAKKSTGKA